MPSRFYSKKDIDTFDKFNKELVGDLYSGKDGIIYQPVVIYKVSAYDTETNMYGEASEGKVYKQGVKLPCIVNAEDFDFDYTDFGADNKQNVSFAFQRAYLVEVNVKPDIGDIFKWNEGYFEVNSYNENQLVGGDPTKSHSIVVQAHLVRMPTNNLEEYRGS